MGRQAPIRLGQPIPIENGRTEVARRFDARRQGNVFPQGHEPGHARDESLHAASIASEMWLLLGDGRGEPKCRLVARQERQGGERGGPIAAPERHDGLKTRQSRIGEVAQVAGRRRGILAR